MTHRLSPTSVSERFWSKVEKQEPDSCWVWKAGKTNKGYGTINIEGKQQYAHRVAYELSNGPFSRNLLVIHSCDNPPCVNPAHLRTGTQMDNMYDRDSRGRNFESNKTHCAKGHLYDAANTRSNNGKRSCRRCHVISVSESRNRKKETKNETLYI